MTRLLWWHCFAGVAGDMALASLLDAGADLAEVRSLLGRLPLDGWSLDVEDTARNGIGATRVVVGARDDGIVRTHAHIVGLIEEARLPDRTRRRALATFGRLAEAEARIHRRPVNQVHFHEVGGIDAIVDIVGTCAALEVLGVDEVRASAVATGTGVVRSAHGALPNPAPAVVALLAGAPTYGRDVAVELTTPTGAALVSTLAAGFGPLPPMTVWAAGFGAGSRDLPTLPNVVQAVLGTADAEERATQPAVELACNVDDATGEQLAHAVAALLDAGAHDAWISATTMKKGRPGHTVSALADPALAEQVAAVLGRETGSLGVRSHVVERWVDARRTRVVRVGDLPVRVKVSPGRAKAEYDDVRRVASLTGRTVRDVIAEAETQARPAHPPRPAPVHPVPPEDAG